MNVICTAGSRWLTEGKEYKVLAAMNGKYTVHNDRGDRMSYFRGRFDVVGRVKATEAPAKPEGHQWDASRGPQMANPMGRTIFKYGIPALERFRLNLPTGAEIIRIAHIDGFSWVWAVVDLRKPTEERFFRAFKTGATIPDTFDTSSYVGFYPIFVQQELGLYVFEDKA
jgi:hypothetical protein